ncbi:hypothetical protein SAMN04487996_110209 [Dyadobacter soli]|uniref:Lipoprotein n=1 Tax=Dyadobacter soli TaxID=659014 RepID=A0A1G7KTL2_9BACT|nr:hypothetical protein [Dyadobacter soli]SDF40270.1 hypothetical protein SAMN04487996_110209 [Dyadobacter soli]
MKNQRISLVCIITLAALFSCKKKDPEPDCGCDGPTVLILKNTRASHEGAGIFTFTHPVNLAKITAIACSPDSIWTKSASSDIPNYTIAGNLKKECFFGPTNMVVFPAIEITEIKKD